MAKEKEQAVVEQPAEAAAPTKDQLMAEMQSAMKSGDWKLVSQVSRKIDTIVKAAEKAELDAKRATLDKMSDYIKEVLMTPITAIYESGKLDAADGIWFSYDFGEQAPTVRLTKTATKAPRAGGGTGKKFDISTDDLLAEHGQAMFSKSMTYRQAYESNTDKNWRYGIRTKLLKLENII